MKISKLFLALALCAATVNVLAKDGAPSGVGKSYADIVKPDRRNAVVPETSDLDATWQPYLRWHRDATAMRGADAGLNGRQRFLQL